MSGDRHFLPGLVAALLLFALAAMFWFAEVDWASRPAAKPITAPLKEFSAERAESVLSRILGAGRPHPVSTPENAAIRARILKELSGLAVPARVHSGFTCNAEQRFGLLSCATVSDIVGEIAPGNGKAIVLMAHYDSVPAGPGAADDESSVATIIEAARALKTVPVQFHHPILALFTDGEEAGMLGAALFLHDPALRARVGVVINAEARGNRGRSLLFQTSAGNGPLIDLYARNISTYAASSLYQEIYRFLPNDTDLTLFIREGIPSFNFAFTEDVAQYHTVRDTRANLDPQSLQQQGDNVLKLVHGLEQTDFAHLTGFDEIYVDLLGRLFLHVPVQWALPLSVAAFLMLLAAAWLRRGEIVSIGARAAAFAVLPALVLGAALVGWLLHTLAQYVSCMPDPSYANPTVLRLAFAFAIGALALPSGRFAPAPAIAVACWLWMGGLGILVAILLPGFAPYFLIPSVVAAVLLLIAAALAGSWNGIAGHTALLLSAAPALLLWIGLGAAGETVMGLKLHPLVTVPFALGLSTLLPMFAVCRLSRPAGNVLAGVMAITAVALAVLAGKQPAYSPGAPQRLNITYVEQDGRAEWGVDALAPVPKPLQKAARFDETPNRVSPLAWSSLYLGPAGVSRDTPPAAHLLADKRSHDGRHMVLSVHGSTQARQMFVVLEHPRGLRAIEVNDWHFAAPPDWASRDRIVIACMSRDCASMKLALTLSGHAPLEAIVGEQRFSLPPGAAPLLAARPNTAVPSQNGDGTLLLAHFHAPSA